MRGCRSHRNIGRMFVTICIVALAVFAKMATIYGGTSGAAHGGDFLLSLRLIRLLHSPRLSAPVDLYIELMFRQQQWEREVYGHALDYNLSEAFGEVEDISQVGNDVALRLDIIIPPDAWVPAAKCKLDIKLKMDKDMAKGSYQGSCGFYSTPMSPTILPSEQWFRGAYTASDVNGSVVGQFIYLPAKVHTPASPDEHPRLLFRKNDEGGLRHRIESDFGKVALELIKSAKDNLVAQSFMYALTREQAYAEHSRKLTEIAMKDFTPGPFNLGHAHGPRVRSIAIAYDCCYDAWDESFKRRVVTYLSYMAERLLLRPYTLSSKVNAHPSSNYTAKMLPGGLAAALAVWGERWSDFPSPDAPKKIEIPPIHNLPVGEKAPVVPLEIGQTPKEWLIVGPFERFIFPYDPLGCEEIIPDEKKKHLEVGMDISYIGKRSEVRRLSSEFVEVDQKTGKVRIEALNPIKRAFLSTTYYYTVISNNQPRWVQLHLRGPARYAYIAGVRVGNEDFVHLMPGLYPFLVEVVVALSEPWAKSYFEAFFDEIQPGRMDEMYEMRKRAYAEVLEIWEKLRRRWEAINRRSLLVERLIRIGINRVGRYASMGLGEWGWNTEGDSYTHYSCDEPMLVATISRNVIGELHPNMMSLCRMPVLELAMALWDEKPSKHSYGGGSGVLNLHHYSRIFPTIPEEFKPAVLWAWLKTAGINEPESWDGNPVAVIKPLEGEEAVYAFLNYPLGLKPRNPDGVVPKAIADLRKGGFVFRNRWRDEKDIIFTIFAKSNPIRPCWQMDNAGDFRIWGLGGKWFIQGAGDKNQGSRLFQNVVLDSENHGNGLGGRIVFYEGEKDGSGRVSIDMSDVFLSRKEPGQEVRNRYGDKIDSNVIDRGIKAIRAIGVDYSGRAGVPALFVIVDSISGGGEKLWQAAVHPGCEVEITGQRFIMKLPRIKATLQGCFIAPDNVSIEVGAKTTFAGKAHQPFGENGRAIWARGGNFYFLVMTLQDSDAPAIEIRRDGKDVIAVINKRVVRFDGMKVIFD